MSEYTNRAVVLRQRPQGEIQQGDLVLEERPVRSPNEGEVVAQVLWLSLDPYMRPRMNDAKGYMDPIGIDEPIVGECVARIVESRSDELKVGDLVTCYSGWQEYVTFPANAPMVYKIQERDNVPLQAYLGVAGMPGCLYAALFLRTTQRIWPAWRPRSTCLEPLIPRLSTAFSW